MCLLSLLYPTNFIEEWLLVVEAVIIFGSGVAGLSVLTHMHTPPWLTPLCPGKTIGITHEGYHSLHDSAEALTHFRSAFSNIFHPPTVHLRAGPMSVHVPHAQEFSWISD